MQTNRYKIQQDQCVCTVIWLVEEIHRQHGVTSHHFCCILFRTQCECFELIYCFDYEAAADCQLVSTCTLCCVLSCTVAFLNSYPPSFKLANETAIKLSLVNCSITHVIETNMRILKNLFWNSLMHCLQFTCYSHHNYLQLL